MWRKALWLCLALHRVVNGEFKLTGCPPAASLHPCNCTINMSDQVLVDCINIEDADTLEKAIDSLKGREVDFLNIKDSTLNFLPHDLFQDVHVKGIDLERTSFISFTNKDVAFVGLEDSLEVLTIIDCTLMSAWYWGHLRNVTNLFRLDIIGGDMDSVGEDVSEIGHLPIIDLAFSKNQITWIHDTAFTTYKDLAMLSLDHNELTQLKRSMLPNPASELRYLDLQNNNIMNLPNDFFTEMPALMDVLLDNNKLLTLNEKVFTPIWKQLELFGCRGNKIRCDCRLSWILNYEKPRNVRAKLILCEEPKRLKGLILYELSKDDLWC